MNNKPLVLRWALVGVAGMGQVHLRGDSPEQTRMVRASLAEQKFEGRTLPLPGLMGSPGKPVADGSITIDQTTPYCAANAFELPGQAWRVDFSTGGIIPDFNNLTTGQIEKPKFSTIFRGMTAPSNLKGEVALIVADNFGWTPIEVSKNAPKKGTVTKFNLSHGALVVSHIRSLLEEAGYEIINAAGLTVVFQKGKQEKRHIITLYGVNIGGQQRDTEWMVPVLMKKVNVVRNENKNIDIVLNMSFSIIPCDVIQRYHDLAPDFESKTGQRYTFRAFIDDEARLKSKLKDPDFNYPRNQKAVDAARAELLLTPPNNEPLTQWLSGMRANALEGESRFLAVASSGNFGLSISTLPAAWPGVISVGATGWKGKTPGLPAEGNWSDRGDITSMGEWFKLNAKVLDDQCNRHQALFCVEERSTPLSKLAPNFGYRGTSFSAPSIAAMIVWQISGDAGNPDDPKTCFPNRPAADGSKPPETGWIGIVKGENRFFNFRTPC